MAEIVIGVQLPQTASEAVAIVSGLLAIVLGLLLIAAPSSGAIALVITIGIFAILYGSAITGFGLSLFWAKRQTAAA